MTYKGYVSYEIENEKHTHERGGFETVADATNWVANGLTYFMLHWGEIDENGLVIWAEVCDEGEENSIRFSDGYELRCGC